MVVEDWIRKIKGENYREVETERQKIYVKNCEKTTGKKVRNKYEDGS